MGDRVQFLLSKRAYQPKLSSLGFLVGFIPPLFEGQVNVSIEHYCGDFPKCSTDETAVPKVGKFWGEVGDNAMENLRWESIHIRHVVE
jgi:hypothetical protein